MEIFCRFTSLLASWRLTLQGKIFTSFLVISQTPANFLSLMEADARRAIDSTGSITLWEPQGCTKKARCRVGATSSSSCSWCSSRDLCLGVECLPCAWRFWEHTLLRVHFLRVYIFENTLVRVCFESSRIEGGWLEVEWFAFEFLVPFLTYRLGRGGGTKEIASIMLGFFIADCILAPKRTEEEKRRRRRLVDGSGSLTVSRSSWKLSMSSIGVRPYWCAIGKPVAHFRSCNFIIPRTAPVQHPPLMASPPMCAHRGFLYVYASKLGTVQDDSGQDCVEGNYITCQHGSLRMVMPPTTCKASGRKPSGSITS